MVEVIHGVPIKDCLPLDQLRILREFQQNLGNQIRQEPLTLAEKETWTKKIHHKPRPSLYTIAVVREMFQLSENLEEDCIKQNCRMCLSFG